MTRSLVDHLNMILTLVIFLMFDVALCQLPTYNGSLVFKNVGIKLCQIKCVESGFCRSIEYTISTLTCHLSEMDHDTITKEAQHFVGSKDLADVRAGSCQLKTCPNRRCVETRTGKTDCVKDKRVQTQAYTELNTTIFDACMIGDLVRVKSILSDNGTNINSVGKDNMTPVMHAAKEGHREVFELLAKEGANLSLVDDGDRNILHFACIGGNVDIVKHVIAQNIVSINSLDEDRQTAAMNAALYKGKAVFDLLVEAKADLSLVNEYNETILHAACEGGNVEIIKYLLTHDIVDIDSRDVDGRTPVMRAANAGHRKVFELLVKEGANLSLVDDEVKNILHLACIGGNVDIVKHVIAQNIVSINSLDEDRQTAAMNAALYKGKAVFDLLVEAKADLSLVNKYNETILHVACEGGNVEIIKYLLKFNIVNIDSRDWRGWTPIMRGTNEGHKSVFDVLVDKGADLSLLSEDKETILHLACEGNNVAVIKYLLKHEIVDIDCQDNGGRTPAMIAAFEGCKNALEFLIEAGADLSLVDNERDTILHLACGGGNVEIVNDLLSRGIVDIDSRNADGWTLLFHAVRAGEKNVFNLLVEKGADLSLVYDENETLLHEACTVGTIEIIKCLLTHDIVDIDSRDSNGWTPVMDAASVGHKRVFDVLVEARADLSLVNNNNETILHVVCEDGNVEIIKYLLTHDIVDINSRDMDGWTPVMRAAKAGHKDAFDILVEAGADLLSVNDVKETILHLSCEGENVDITKYLLTHKIVDIDSRDVDGYTPVMYTAVHNNKDAFDLLVKWGADLLLPDEESFNILHVACNEDSTDIVTYLLSHNIVDINSRDGNDCTPAMIAAREGRETAFFQLVENGADLTITNSVGDNILNMACEGGNKHILQYVITQRIVKGPYREDDPC